MANHKGLYPLAFGMTLVPLITQMASNKIHTNPYLVQDKRQSSSGLLGRLEVANTHIANLKLKKWLTHPTDLILYQVMGVGMHPLMFSC